MRAVGWLAAALAAGVHLGAAQTDFSGRWVFDREKSLVPGPDGRLVVASIMGDEFVAKQDEATLTLDIKAGTLTVIASYDLAGRETRNLSPGPTGVPDVAVFSRARWDGERLVIVSQSAALENGRAVTMITRRVLYLHDGDLVIERTGTPESLVKPSRSVYRRIR